MKTKVIYEWIRHFFVEIKHVQVNKQHILLILDSYGVHLQFRTLQILIENSIIFTSLLYHKVHVLQPLDLPVFSFYKSDLLETFTGVEKQESAGQLGNHALQ